MLPARRACSKFSGDVTILGSSVKDLSLSYPDMLPLKPLEHPHIAQVLVAVEVRERKDIFSGWIPESGFEI